MPIYALGDLEPNISSSAFIHPDAVIIGSVTIGSDSSVWPCAVLRGDTNNITIGERTSIQDGAIVHCTADLPTVVGDDCTVGHNAHLEGCIVESGALIGSGSLVLHRVHVHSGALVAAGAVCTQGLIVPADALAVGVPARIKEGAADKNTMEYSAKSYQTLTKRYSQELRRLH
jgi:carbonic anhydrase/acetyltransferase-like protein (isoleucine patch superfamily)